QVYQQNDTGGYLLVATVSGTTLQTTISNGPVNSGVGAGFNQCFRIVANTATGVTPTLASNSNTACVAFDNKLAFYNIITPNGDGQNDVLIIDNVTLYPGNSLSIFNRWGREVYATTNYQNNWGSEASIAAGTYYYLFKLANGTATKGWLEVVK
ncbi:MAG: gliding motility-associated C-terminal domain-containing protein, partial [Hymenobacter sp.]